MDQKVPKKKKLFRKSDQKELRAMENGQGYEIPSKLAPVTAVDFTLTNQALNLVYQAMSKKVEPINFDAPNNPFELPDETCKCGRPANGGICRECRKDEQDEYNFNVQG